MIATYKNHTIEPVKREGMYHALIDGKESGIKPAKYRGAARNRAMRLIDEQERRQAITQLKELGL